MKPEKELDVPKLKALLEKATFGPWHLSTGIMGDALWISSWWRDRGSKGDGPIAHVSTKNTRSEKETYGDSYTFTHHPIKTARADAELIVEAVNALPELLRRLNLDIDETAWLIEWRADKYGPIRYWAAGEPKPVIDANLATRFSRQEDAKAVMGAYADLGASVAEHMWIKPKKRKPASAIEARSDATGTGLAEGESATAKPGRPKEGQ